MVPPDHGPVGVFGTQTPALHLASHTITVVVFCFRTFSVGDAFENRITSTWNLVSELLEKRLGEVFDPTEHAKLLIVNYQSSVCFSKTWVKTCSNVQLCSVRMINFVKTIFLQGPSTKSYLNFHCE